MSLQISAKIPDSLQLQITLMCLFKPTEYLNASLMLLSSRAYTNLSPTQQPESSLKWHSRLIFDESAAAWSLQKNHTSSDNEVLDIES